MKLRIEHTSVFPSPAGVSVDDLRENMSSVFGDGIISGFDPNIAGDTVVFTPGRIICDGVVITYTSTITVPKGRANKKIYLVYDHSDVNPIPEIFENYSGDKPRVCILSLTGGEIIPGGRTMSGASKKIEAFGFTKDVSRYNALVDGGLVTNDHHHVGTVITTAVVQDVDDGDIIEIPRGAIVSIATIKRLGQIQGGISNCYINKNGRVRCFTELDNAVVARGVATVTHIIAKSGSTT